MTAAAIPGILRLVVALVALVVSLVLRAQEVKYWVGGNGQWSDAAHWSWTPGGPGGAGVPQAHEPVHIATDQVPLQVTVEGAAVCGGLTVVGRQAPVTVSGQQGAWRIAGDWSLQGAVQWERTAPVELSTDGVAELDLRGVVLNGAVNVMAGAWSQRNDVVLASGRDLSIQGGTWSTNGALLRAGGLHVAGNASPRLLAGSSAILLEQLPSGAADGRVQADASRLIVAGSPVEWGPWSAENAQRNINVCGTGPGQTLFTINAHLTSNYNGYGVSCHGVCDGAIQVTVTGGVGPFTYQWVAGPNTSVWNNVCPGNQIVIVTDQGQHLGCATTVQVTDPALLNVIFFGGVAPTCAGVCDGELTAFAVGGVPSYTYNWNNGAGSGTLFEGLCPGTNTLRVTDSNNCTFDSTFIFNIQPIAPNLSTTNVSCFGECDGTAEVAATGGGGSFTYDWGPGSPPGDGTPAVSGLCPGNYTVTITDVNACDTTVSFVITQPSEIIPAPTQTPASCAGSCDGTASVAPGPGNFSFAWGPQPVVGDGTPNATGLCAGVYTCLITDQVTGCDTLVSFTITAPPSILPHETWTDVACAGECTGQIVTAPTGGSGSGFGYLWSPTVTGQGTPVASALCAGSYEVTITDGAGCDTTITVSIIEPTPLVLDTAHTDVSCHGSCDGTATATASGGTSGHAYHWSPEPGVGQGTATAGQLCPGPWVVTITDGAGCDTTVTFHIAEPAPLTVDLVLAPATCSPGCDGTATATVNGGMPGYTYLWDPAPLDGQGTPVAEGFCPGTYELTVTDLNGCDTTVTFTITEPAPLVVAPMVTDATCLSACDGGIALSVSGGVSSYTYFWTPDPGPQQGSATLTGLCAGDWSVTITDAAHCDTTLTWTIAAPPVIEPQGTFTAESCLGPCDGTATVAPIGGLGTYTYEWAPGDPAGDGTPTVTGLCPGDWSVTISDGTCDTTWTFTIWPMVPIVASTTQVDVLCAGSCTGEATVDATGGSGPLVYEWEPGTPPGDGTPSVTGLCAGTWTVTVSDGTGCDTTLTVVITGPLPISPGLVVLAEDCTAPCTGRASVAPMGGAGGFSYDWSPDFITGDGTATVSGLCAGVNYSVTITDASGCDTTVAFTVDPFQPLTIVPTVIPTTCIGDCDGQVDVVVSGGAVPYTYLWALPVSGQGTPHATGLCAGDYDLNIRDDNGCDTTITITVPGPLPFTVDAVLNTVSCAGSCDGTIDITVTGANGNYTFDWGPGAPAGDGTASVSGLCAGDWTVTIVDQGGCDTTLTFTLTEPPLLVGSADVTPSHCGVCDGAIQLHASGGVGPYTFHWGAPINAVTTDSLRTGVCAGIVPVVITDASGCSVNVNAPVTDSDAEVLTITDGSVSCDGLCNGEVAVSFNCSFPSCTVAWSDAAGDPLGVTTNTMGGLCPGDYIVQVTNGDGCITIDTATVVAATPITASITSTPLTCAGVCDGTASIVLSAPPTATITWGPPPFAAPGATSVTGLCAQEYTVAIGNTGGCDTTFTVLITGPVPITVDAAVVDETCAGSCDGTIDLTLSGGTGALSVTWQPVQPGGPSLSGLCAGTYIATVTDAVGCSTTDSLVVNAPPALTLGVTSTQSHCALCDGTVTATPAGGSGLVLVVWTDLSNTEVGTGPSLSGLCAGTYTATATDENGCTVQSSVQVTDADGETINAVDGQVLCATACDGVVSVDYTCGTPACSTIWYDAANQVIAQNVDVVSGLCAGTYVVVVTNGNDCRSVDTALVVPVQPILVDVAVTPVGCHGHCNGAADLTISGGTGSFDVTWTPVPGAGQGTSAVTGLCEQSYQVHIVDQAGCDTTLTVVVPGVEPITVDAVITDVSCHGLCDGAIAITATGGQGGYTYDWDGNPTGDGTAAITGVCPGPITVRITDVSGCDTTFTFTVAEPAQLTSGSTATGSHCAVCDATASALPAGGTAPYTYAWTLAGGAVGTDSTLTGLCAGVYQLEVTDANGCTVMTGVSISDAEGEVTSTTGSTVSCPTDCDGTAEVHFTCSLPICTVAWFDPSGTAIGQTSSVATSLCSGNYLVEVTNGDGCITVDTATVAAPTAITLQATLTDPSCAGDCDGRVELEATGGTGTLSFNWEPDPITDGTPVAAGLCAGAISVTVTDDAGCSITEQFTLVAPLPVTGVAVVDPITCAGACDASITVMAEGGTGPGTYSYDWSPGDPTGEGTATVTDLCAGTWQVQLTDANGCGTSLSITVTEPPVLVVDLQTTNNGCYGDCEGSAQVTVSGGVPDHAIVWLNAAGDTLAQDVGLLGSLCAGDFAVHVIDGAGCRYVEAFTITQGEALLVDLSVLGESCNGPCDGTASVVVTGGNGSYSYDWGPGSPTGDGTATVIDLCADAYTFTVTDAAGCDSTLQFTVLPFSPIQVTSVLTAASCHSSCDGAITLTGTGGVGTLTYTWTPLPGGGQGTAEVTGLCAGAYDVEVVDQAGCSATFSFTIAQPDPLTITLDGVVDASCAAAGDGSIAVSIAGGTPTWTTAWSGPPGFTSEQEDPSGLLPGNYVLTVTDANDCVATLSATVGSSSTVVADAGADQAVCPGTAVQLDGSASQGSNSWTWSDEAGNLFGTGVTWTLNDLTSGTHAVVLTVGDGTCSDNDTLWVTVHPDPAADAGLDVTVLMDDQVVLGGQPSGLPGSGFVWSPDSILSSGTVPNPTATMQQTTLFTLTVTSPEGCVGTDQVLVTVEPEFVVTSGFTPNGDGWNDTWRIGLIHLFPQCEVEIFNRWGEPLFRSVGYNTPWDGRYAGGYVPVGTYYYTIVLNDPRFPDPFTGPLTVIR